MRFEDLDIDYLLSNTFLHFTGITAALSESCHNLMERLVLCANERNIPISFDANVRWRLFDILDRREEWEGYAVRGVRIDARRELVAGCHWGSTPAKTDSEKTILRSFITKVIGKLTKVCVSFVIKILGKGSSY